MRVGIVLASVPGYSETFFRSKVRFLQEREDFEVVLFADKRIPGLEWSLCKIVYGVQGMDGKWTGAVLKLIHFAKTFLFYPITTFKLMRRNRQSGFALFANILSVIRSSHLFSQELDWLHFGFGTMAIGRENLAAAMRAKMAVSFRGFDHYVYPIKNPGCYKNTFRYADKFHVLSEAMKSHLIVQGIAESKIQVVTPAIDVSKFKIERERIGSFTDGHIKIVTVARLHWIKGLEYTLEALSLLKANGNKFSCTIIGSGPERERLVFAAHQLGLDGCVTFVGKKEPVEVIEYLRNADVYIQSSIQEGFCNAVLEAQAMGLLCIVSDADGLKENVQHGVTGWITGRRNSFALAEQIRDVFLLDSEKRKAVSSRAIERVVDQFSIQQQRDKFVQFYRG